jgi:indolepyruvate ferredoxin oxidoreductase beta subunit
MKYDVILAGVGGQGVLSVAAIIAMGAMKEGFQVKQSEVHGMAQRGGAVQAHLRIADKTIPSDLIGFGKADMILSMEPLESLRYLKYLKPEGVFITSKNPFENIPNYPDSEGVYASIRSLPNHHLVDAAELAKEAGSPRATNMVMVGAAAAHLPVSRDVLVASIEELFSSKGENVVGINKKAFGLGDNSSGDGGSR